MRAGIQITTQHYRKHGTANNIDEILVDLERYTSQYLEDSSSIQMDEPNQGPDLLSAEHIDRQLITHTGKVTSETAYEVQNAEKYLHQL